MSESGRESLPDVREWLGSAPGFAGVGGGPSRMFVRSSRIFESGRGPLSEVQERSGDPPDFAGVIGSSFRMSRSGR